MQIQFKNRSIFSIICCKNFLQQFFAIILNKVDRLIGNNNIIKLIAWSTFSPHLARSRPSSRPLKPGQPMASKATILIATVMWENFTDLDLVASAFPMFSRPLLCGQLRSRHLGLSDILKATVLIATHVADSDLVASAFTKFSRPPLCGWLRSCCLGLSNILKAIILTRSLSLYDILKAIVLTCCLSLSDVLKATVFIATIMWLTRKTGEKSQKCHTKIFQIFKRRDNLFCLQLKLKLSRTS